MTNHKENAGMNQKSDMVIIGMEDNVMRNERMKDLIDGFKDKWIAKNMIEFKINLWMIHKRDFDAMVRMKKRVKSFLE